MKIYQFILHNIKVIGKMLQINQLKRKFNASSTSHTGYEKAIGTLSQQIYFVKKISNFDLTFELTKLYGLIQNVDDRTTDAVDTNYMLRDLAYQIDCPVKIMQAYKLLALSL